MSLDIEGKKCPVCGAYIFEEDDIVFCPECGAPHHRDCYNAIGHCALENLHGTDKQYDKVNAADNAVEKNEKIKIAYHTAGYGENRAETVKCSVCQEEYAADMRTCPKCGAPNIAKLSGGRYIAIDLLGGVPADTDLGDGVTAADARKFVSANTQRYIPKFAAMKAGIRASWNWLAFLFPSAWFLSRKMYKNGVMTGILSIAFSMLTIPFSNAFYYLDMSQVHNYFQMAQLVVDNLPQIGIASIISALVGILLNLLLKIFVGITGDYFYRKHTISAVSKIKNESEDEEEDFHRLGGVSFWAMLIGIFAVQYLPSIIAMFAM